MSHGSNPYSTLAKSGLCARQRSFQFTVTRLGQSPAISTATILDEAIDAVATGAATRVTRHAHHIELAG
jgi:hypothetical protein